MQRCHKNSFISSCLISYRKLKLVGRTAQSFSSSRVSISNYLLPKFPLIMPRSRYDPSVSSQRKPRGRLEHVFDAIDPIPTSNDWRLADSAHNRSRDRDRPRHHRPPKDHINHRNHADPADVPHHRRRRYSDSQVSGRSDRGGNREKRTNEKSDKNRSRSQSVHKTS